MHQPVVKRQHERLVVDQLLREGCLSRAQLARRTRLSSVTVGKLVDGLLEERILAELTDAGPAMEGMGRPGRPVNIDAQEPRIVTVELEPGQTTVGVSGLSPRGSRAAGDLTFATPPSPDAFRQSLKEARRRLPQGALWATVLSTPGVTDDRHSRVLWSPNLHWLERCDLPGLLRSVWDVPVCLVQEVQALAIGQLLHEPAKRDFLLVDFGDGVGGAAVIDGRLFESATAISCELGHVRVGGHEPCGCGGRGCLETVASRPAVLHRFRDVMRRPRADWDDLQRAMATDAAGPWLVTTIESAATVIGGTLNVLGLTHVVLTGWVAELPQAMLSRFEVALRRCTLGAQFADVSVSTAQRHRRAGMIARVLDRVILPARVSISESAAARQVRVA